MSNTTNVVGYYNGNRWPIQVVASKLNITLTLKPGEYVVDRQGRKVNDPYFEVFAVNKQLHRELSKTPVPVIAIPEVTPAVTPSAQTNPVRAITEWTRDGKGIRQPVLTQPAPEALPPAVTASASESVRPMSMDEARRLGLVRKVREVPEDYGVTDTTGLPPSGIPKMKYAIDPSVNKPVPPLPKEMLALPSNDPNRQTRAQLVAGLAQGTKTPAPEDGPANPFANAAVVNNSPIMAGTPAQPLMEEGPTEGGPVVEGTPEEGFLPEPDVAELAEAQAAVRPAPLVVTPALPLRPLTPSNQFTCMACGAPHKWRSQLLNHAKAKHPERVNAIMAAYPPVAAAPPALP